MVGLPQVSAQLQTIETQVRSGASWEETYPDIKKFLEEVEDSMERLKQVLLRWA